MAIILQTVDRPELQDDHLENSRKVPLDRHDIIIDKVRIFNYIKCIHILWAGDPVFVSQKDVAKEV